MPKKRRTPITNSQEIKGKGPRICWHTLKPILKKRTISLDEAINQIIIKNPEYTSKESSLRVNIYEACKQDPELIIKKGNLHYKKISNPEATNEPVDGVGSAIKKILRNHKHQLQALEQEKQDNYYVDFIQLETLNQESSLSLKTNPEEILDQFHSQMLDYLVERKEPVFMSIENYPDEYVTSISDLNSREINQLVCVEGVVTTMSDRYSKIDDACFVCNRCGEDCIISQKKTYSLIEPRRCRSCGKADHRLVLSESTFNDIQSIKIQEQVETSQRLNTRDIKVILQGDLIDICEPGDRIRVVGVLKNKINKKSRIVYQREIHCLGVEGLEEDYDTAFSQEDIDEFKKFSQEKELYDLIIQTISPDIKGNTEVKEGIMLQLFGGRPHKRHSDGKTINRWQINMLLIGDPGTAKSVMIEYACNLHPKGTSTSSKGLSEPGLTGNALKEETPGGGSHWTVQAGLLPLYHNGILGLQELDKIHPQTLDALHEPLEQQVVNIDKAGGAKARFKAETALLASANPIHGNFDKYKPLPAQFNMPSSLLSRFDLIFPFMDTPDEDRDREIAQHMLKGHIEDTHIEPDIPLSFLKKYINYARQNCHPRINNDVGKKLIEYYTTLRSSTQAGHSKLTARLVDVLVRLSEASAKVRLSETVDESDADRAIKMMNFMFTQLARGDKGEFNVDNIMGQTSKNMTQRDKYKFVLNKIDSLEGYGGGLCNYVDLVEECYDYGVGEEEVQKILGYLQEKNKIYSPKTGYYKLINN